MNKENCSLKLVDEIVLSKVCSETQAGGRLKSAGSRFVRRLFKNTSLRFTCNQGLSIDVGVNFCA